MPELAPKEKPNQPLTEGRRVDVQLLLQVVRHVLQDGQREDLVVAEREALVERVDRVLQLAHQRLHEPDGRERGRRLWLEHQRPLVQVQSFAVPLVLAHAVGQVVEQGLPRGRNGLAVLGSHSRDHVQGGGEQLLSTFETAIKPERPNQWPPNWARPIQKCLLLGLELGHGQLVQDEHVHGGDGEGAQEEHFRQVKVLRQAALDADVEQGQVAAPHQLRGLEVGGHRLVVLVLLGERVAVGDPGGAEQAVEGRGLGEVAPSEVALVDQVVVAADGVPGHGLVRIQVHQLVGHVEELCGKRGFMRCEKAEHVLPTEP